MNYDEQIVQKYLNIKYQNVIHEPDGNVPPDFLAEDTIAIEVRRLNQTQDGHGLEDDYFKIQDLILGQFNELTKGKLKKSYYLHTRFLRPIPPTKEIKKAIKKSVAVFLKNNENQPFSFQFANDELNEDYIFEISLIGSEQPLDKIEFGASADFNEGGWVQSIYQTEIQRCIDEKSNKITKNAIKQYNHWELILVDSVQFLDRETKESLDFDLKQFKKLTILDVKSNVLFEQYAQ